MAEATSTADRPTIVLVHGAFADASSWNGVIPLLQQQGYTVIAPPNPLRGVTFDSDYIASVLGQIDGPILLVGHSYGGAVITNAATDAPNVLGLVYVAAFAPDGGERLGEVAPDSKDSVLNTVLVPHRYPAGDGKTATEFSIDPAGFHDAFAVDVPKDQTVIMAVTQRPIAEAAFSDQSGPPAWKILPSWAVVAVGDKAVGTDLARSMAQRAGAEITEIEGSHVIMISQPQAVTDVIVKAAEAVASG
jgi:pimeloyl-ACP methyl ester carboxylesterase